MFHVERSSGIPLYLQIKDQIINKMSMNNLSPGTLLPSIRKLADELDVATATVRHAYEVLEKEGFVVAHQGKGMLVADLDERARRFADEDQASVMGLFTTAIGRAFAMGASADQVRVAAAQAFAAWEGVSQIVFVGSSQEFIDYYVPLLQAKLQDLDVEIRSRLLDDSTDLTDTLDLFRLPLCVVTLVRSYGIVRDSLKDLPVPVLAVALNLSDASREELVSIPPQLRVALVVESRNLMGFRNMVEQYVALSRPMSFFAAEHPELAVALRDFDVVLHTLGARQSIDQAAPARARRVELHFVPDQISLARIKQIVSLAARSIDVFA